MLDIPRLLAPNPSFARDSGITIQQKNKLIKSEETLRINTKQKDIYLTKKKNRRDVAGYLYIPRTKNTRSTDLIVLAVTNSSVVQN